ncbi:MAG: UDP-2,3-diacylglucosamine diphosphatase [Runella zeae]
MSFQQLEVQLLSGKKIFFASDFHLGAPTHAKSLERERQVVKWLESIRHEAQVICLVGDLFDFWYEHRRVVPKGFVRFLGKLGELTDAGIEVIVFPGNHDMWMTDYLVKELSVKMYRRPLEMVIQSPTSTTRFLVTHGDGLGPGDYSYKVLQKVFESKISRWAFGNLMHPDWALWLGQSWAEHSWKKHAKADLPQFLGEKNEWLIQYAIEQENKKHHDFYVFGHRHIEVYHAIGEGQSHVVILGDWIVYQSYATFDGQHMSMQNFGTPSGSR